MKSELPVCRRSLHLRTNFRSTTIRGLKLFAVGFAYLAIGASVPAHAGSCQSAKAQSLKRQLAATSTLLKKFNCTGSERGIFSGCAEYNRRALLLTRQLAEQDTLSGCAATERREPAKRRVSVPRKSAERAAVRPAAKQQDLAVHDVTVCVRLSDGYYFPSPNSGYKSSPSDHESILAQCRLICGTDGMDVFKAGGPELAETMVSITTGRPYAELRTAGAYRNTAQFERCEQARYTNFPQGGRIFEGNVRSNAFEAGVTNIAQENEMIVRGIAATLMRGSLPIQEYPRKVRTVGPAYFPDEISLDFTKPTPD